MSGDVQCASPVVAVVGSLNMDRTFRVPRIPAPGETLRAREAFTCFGGKGANQAVAARRAGAEVQMIGCVGDDEDGVAYRSHLEAEGIDVGQVAVAAGVATGSAFITVDDAGENAIVVHAGANDSLMPDMVEAEIFAGVDVVLMQLECPLETVAHAAAVARKAGAEVMVNPSPWDDRVREAGVVMDTCIVNETEARALVGRDIAECLGDPAGVLDAAGCGALVVTRGSGGTLVFSRSGQVIEAEPPDVSPVDTVGAGDTFAGALAVARASGMGWREAADFANAAAALSTLALGAQAAIPRRERVEEMLAGC